MWFFLNLPEDICVASPSPIPYLRWPLNCYTDYATGGTSNLYGNWEINVPHKAKADEGMISGICHLILIWKGDDHMIRITVTWWRQLSCDWMGFFHTQRHLEADYFIHGGQIDERVVRLFDDFKNWWRNKIRSDPSFSGGCDDTSVG